MAAAVETRDLGVRFRVSRVSKEGRRKLFARGFTDRAWGIRGIDLVINRGEVVGLIGPNGAGKSTLLRAVVGIYSPNEGTVVRNGRVGSLLTPTAGLSNELSGWENIRLSAILLGAARRDLPDLVPAVADFCGVGDWLDADVRTYSSGMRTRLGFSIALHVRPEILVLDEVMAVGDQEFRARSNDAIKTHIKSGGTVLLASHHVTDLVDVCDRLIHMSGGSIVDQGEPDKVIERYIASHGAPPPRIGRNVAAITPRRDERRDS